MAYPSNLYLVKTKGLYQIFPKILYNILSTYHFCLEKYGNMWDLKVVLSTKRCSWKVLIIIILLKAFSSIFSINIW